MLAYLATALFDGVTAARAAASQLVGMGVDPGAVQLVPRQSPLAGATQAQLEHRISESFGRSIGCRRRSAS